MQKHLLKEHPNARECTTKCGVVVPVEETTAWHTDVACTDCLALMNPAPPRRRLVRKRGMIYECGPRTS